MRTSTRVRSRPLSSRASTTRKQRFSIDTRFRSLASSCSTPKRPSRVSRWSYSMLTTTLGVYSHSWSKTWSTRRTFRRSSRRSTRSLTWPTPPSMTSKISLIRAVPNSDMPRTNSRVPCDSKTQTCKRLMASTGRSTTSSSSS